MIDANTRENYAKHFFSGSTFEKWTRTPESLSLYQYKESRLYNLIQEKCTEPLLIITDFDEVKAININKAKFLLWKYFICQR